MAEMIPESIADSSHASRAEKDVFAFLRDVLVPDEEFLVWFEPRLGRKTPDFVIYAKSFGLLVLEVKGYHADKLIALTPKKFTVRNDGREETEDSPLEQAEKSYRDLMDRIKLRNELCHSDGPHKGKPMVPVGYCAAFPSISQSTADQLDITSVVTPTQCLFSEDFEGDPNNRTVQRQFLSKLRPIFTQRVQFRFAGFDNRQELALRTTLSPEVQLSSSRENDIAALDMAQERIAKSIGSGHRILKGVVGSGKSVVVAARAKYLARCNPSWKILVLCYNVSLVSSLRTLVSTNCCEEDKKRIDVLHYHGLVKKVANISLVRDTNVSFEDWEASLANGLVRSLSKNQNQFCYDAILVDEGQDLSKTSYEILDKIAEHITVFADEQQQIYDDGATSSGIYESLGIPHSSRAFLQAYRNSPTVAKLASYFIDHDDRRHQYLAMQHDRTLGRDTPLLYVAPHFEAEMDRLARMIEQRVLQNQKVGVIVLQNRLAHGYAQGLEERGVKVEVLDQGFGNDRKYDFQNNVPKIVSIYNCKGLTFDVVLMPHVRNGAFPRHADNFMRRRLLFVAISRAMEWVYLSKSEDDRLDEESILKSAANEGALILQDSQDAVIDSASSPSDIDLPF